MAFAMEDEVVVLHLQANNNPTWQTTPFTCQLSAEKPIFKFTVEPEVIEDFEVQLSLDFAYIHHDVKDEYNVVEVTTCGENDAEVTKTLAILQRSGQCSASLDDFILEPPVTFRLRAGSGPVEIVGEIIRDLREAVDPRSNEE